MAETNFKIDVLTVNGISYALEDGKASMTGVAGYEQKAIPSATGPDFVSRTRVPRMLKANLQFGAGIVPPDLEAIQGEQIAVRDTLSGRRALLNNCVFASMGELGAGASVEVNFAVLEPIQWL